jgi:hypothetical protein
MKQEFYHCATATDQVYATTYTIFSLPVLAVVAGLEPLALYKFCQYLYYSATTLASSLQHILPFSFSQSQQWQLVSNPWPCENEASVLPLCHLY